MKLEKDADCGSWGRLEGLTASGPQLVWGCGLTLFKTGHAKPRKEIYKRQNSRISRTPPRLPSKTQRGTRASESPWLHQRGRGTSRRQTQHLKLARVLKRQTRAHGEAGDGATLRRRGAPELGSRRAGRGLGRCQDSLARRAQHVLRPEVLVAST